jgi:hypothetical protein
MMRRVSATSVLTVIAILVLMAVPAAAQPVEVVDDFHVPLPPAEVEPAPFVLERDGDEVGPAEVLGVTLEARDRLAVTGIDALLLGLGGLTFLLLGFAALRGSRAAVRDRRDDAG